MTKITLKHHDIPYWIFVLRDECPDEINGNKDTNTTENLQPVQRP